MVSVVLFQDFDEIINCYKDEMKRPKDRMTSRAYSGPSSVARLISGEGIPGGEEQTLRGSEVQRCFGVFRRSDGNQKVDGVGAVHRCRFYCILNENSLGKQALYIIVCLLFAYFFSLLVQ